eukprot:5828591-Lingulodinium_polyedra.AAC.1
MTWSYLAMLSQLMRIRVWRRHWCEGCPCHIHSVDAPQSEQKDVPGQCISASRPLKGRRVPQLACGEMRCLALQHEAADTE